MQILGLKTLHQYLAALEELLSDVSVNWGLEGMILHKLHILAMMNLIIWLRMLSTKW